MKLSLLTPPTDSPFRLPLTQGPPAEGSFAVNTGALPRALPLPVMDPSAAAAPMEALARLGATGLEVSTRTANLLLEKQVRVQEAEAAAQAEQLYAQASYQIDQDVERLKVESTAETIRPGFEAAWKKVNADLLAQNPSPAVQQILTSKLRGLLISSSKEISTAWGVKFRANQVAAFETGVQNAQREATSAQDETDLKIALSHLESTFGAAARAGSIPLDTIQARREKALRDIRTDRAYDQAFLAPMTMLDRIAKGDLQGFETKEVRNLAEYAETRIRTLRSDQENADAQERRRVSAAQDDRAITWRQRITANYAPGGPGLDLRQSISEDARQLGKENFGQMEELHRISRERWLKPETVKASNPDIVGRVQYALTTGRLDDVSQRDLLGWYKSGDLSEGDYTRLSNGLDAKLQARKAEGQKTKTEAEQLRERQTKDAEKLIDDFLSRGSRFQGDPESKRTDILVRDAITTLHMRLQADPTADPIEVADALIESRIASAEKNVKGLPYRDQADVLADYVSGKLDKASATRYWRLLEAIKKAGAPSPAATPGSPGTDIRKPVTP